MQRHRTLKVDRQSTLEAEQASLWVHPSETATRWEQPPTWNEKAETWDDWGREVTLWTDSFGPRQAPTLGPRLVRKLSHLPQVLKSASLGSKGGALEKNPGMESLLTALRHSGLARKVDRHRSETAGNVGTEHEAKDRVRQFRCIWNPTQQVQQGAGSGAEALDASALDASKPCRPVLLENTGLNGSEVCAVLATPENSYDYDRVMSGREELWPKHRLFERDRDAKKSLARCGDGRSSESPENIDERTV